MIKRTISLGLRRWNDGSAEIAGGHKTWLKSGSTLSVATTCLLSVFVSAAPAFAQGAGGADPTAMINNICNFILGPFGQSLAILGIVAIGLTWMFGRASLGMVAGVVGGIIIMFGASFLGHTLTGGG